MREICNDLVEQANARGLDRGRTCVCVCVRVRVSQRGGRRRGIVRRRVRKRWRRRGRGRATGQGVTRREFELGGAGAGEVRQSGRPRRKAMASRGGQCAEGLRRRQTLQSTRRSSAGDGRIAGAGLCSCLLHWLAGALRVHLGAAFGVPSMKDAQMRAGRRVALRALLLTGVCKAQDGTGQAEAVRETRASA
eukprot:3344863-Pleurochrysis_carterae.AAC.1